MNAFGDETTRNCYRWNKAEERQRSNERGKKGGKEMKSRPIPGEVLENRKDGKGHIGR